MSPTCLALLHVMADLEPVFMKNFLRKLDSSEATIFEVFGLSETFVTSMKELNTPLFDQFVSGLKEDEFGNVKYEKFDVDGDPHSIILNYSHHPRRGRAAEAVDRVAEINTEVTALKE